MGKMIYICVDCGKFATKSIAKYEGKVHSNTFRTKMMQVNRLGVDIQPKSYEVIFNGGSHLIGNMVSEDHSDFSLKKASLIHQLSIYTAISHFLQKANIPNDVDIRLAVNVPITTYKDAIQKNEFKQLIQNFNRTIYLTVNGKEFSFRLADVTIAFEGVGDIYAKPDLYKNQNTIVIDIGGLNCTLATYSGLNPLIDTMIVGNLGINVLKGKLGMIINERYGISVSPDDLELILRHGYFSNRGNVYEDSKEFIEEVKFDHLQKIIQFAQSRRYTFNNAEIHFIGGGSIILNQYIKSEFPHAKILDNCQFANCRSFLKILEIKYG